MTSKPSTSGGGSRWRPWYARRRTRSVGSIRKSISIVLTPSFEHNTDSMHRFTEFCRDSNSNYSDEMCCSGSGGYSTSKDTSQRRINSSLQVRWKNCTSLYFMIASTMLLLSFSERLGRWYLREFDGNQRKSYIPFIV